MALDKNIQLKIDTAINNAETVTSIGDIRRALKELQSLAIEYQTTNVEAFNKVTNAAGQLKDKVSDAKAAISSVSGDPIENLGKSFKLAASNLVGLDFTQASSGLKLLTSNIKLLNPSEVSAKFKDLGTQFRAVGDAITEKFPRAGKTIEGLTNVVGGFGKAAASAFGGDLTGALSGVGQAFKGLGQVILANPILILSAVVIELVTHFKEFANMGGILGDVFSGVSSVISGVTEGFQRLTDAIGLTGYAAQKTADALSKQYDRNIQKINEQYDAQTKLNTVMGIDNTGNELKKDQQLVDNALDRMTELATKAKFIRSNLSDKEKEEFDKLTELVEKDARNSISRNKEVTISAAEELAKRTAAIEKANLAQKYSGDELKKAELEFDREQYKKINIIRNKALEEQSNEQFNFAKAQEKRANQARAVEQEKLDESVKLFKESEDKKLEYKSLLGKRSSGGQGRVNELLLLEAEQKKIEERAIKASSDASTATNLAQIYDTKAKTFRAEAKRLSNEIDLTIKENDAKAVQASRDISDVEEKISAEAAAARAKAYAELLKNFDKELNTYKKHYANLQKLNPETNPDKFDKERADLAKRQQFIEDFQKKNSANLKAIDKDKLAVDLEDVKTSLQAVANVEQKYRNDKIKADDELRVLVARTLEEQFDAKRQQITDLANIELAAEGKTAEDKKLINAKLLNDLKAAQEKYFQDKRELELGTLRGTAEADAAMAAANPTLKNVLTAIESQAALEQGARDAKYEAEIAEAERLGRDKKVIQDKYNKLDEAATIQTEKSKYLAKLDNINKHLQVAQYAANALNSLSDLITQNENKGLKAGEKASVDTQRRQFNRQKGLSLVSTVINTAEGITKALAEAPPPSPLGAIGAVLVGISGALQFATIASQKFNPESSSTGSSASSAPNTSSLPGLGPDNSSISTPSLFGLGSSSNNDIGSNRVYVVESDMTDAQGRVKIARDNSRLGN